MQEFAKYVMKRTNQMGVHTCTADGVGLFVIAMNTLACYIYEFYKSNNVSLNNGSYLI